MGTLSQYKQLAGALRSRVTGEGGISNVELRRAALERAAGGGPLPAPYEKLVAQICENAVAVTDADVNAVRAATGSDKASFELIMAAAIGAGLMRFDRAVEAMEGAKDAS